ncbi:MAG TPA: hypothetical protein VLZ12_16030 [Verrucomicrobiae bacterium]|nr:hypothetical protein [Verrucomicrobiae bacterium]
MRRQVARAFLCGVVLASPLASGGAAAAEKQNAFEQEKKLDLEFEGKITTIDATASTVTVKHKHKGPMTFSVAKDCMMFVKHKKGAASLGDFKVGEEVKILYRQDATNVVCRSLWEPGSNPSEKEHKLQKQTQSQ